MSAVCAICGKGPSFGGQVARLGKGAQRRRVLGRSKRMFKPNLQRRKVVVNGTSMHVLVCTACLKKGKTLD